MNSIPLFTSHQSRNIFFGVAVFLLVVGWNIYIRGFTAFLPILSERATQILGQNPAARHDSQAFLQIRQSLKDRYQDDSGQTYLLEYDPWHWGRLVDNVFKTGHPGDVIKDGVDVDMLNLHPTGYPLFWDHFLYHFTAAAYRVYSVFHRVELFHFLFYMPLIFAAVLLGVLYAFSYRYGGHLGAALSVMFVGSAPVVVQRSMAGWFDKDALSLTWPIVIVWFYLKARQSEGWRARLGWMTASGLGMGLFWFTWQHAWFIGLILVLSEVLDLFAQMAAHILKRASGQGTVRINVQRLVFFIGSSSFWTIVICGPRALQELFYQISWVMHLHRPAAMTIWPNVFETVGELSRLSWSQTMNLMGGVGPVFLAAGSTAWMCWIAWRDRKKEKRLLNDVIVLGIWLLSMCYATFHGVRFLIFPLIPLGVSLGWAVNRIYERVFVHNRHFKKAGFAVLFVLLIGVIGWNGWKTARTVFPSMTDPWYGVLRLIRDKTPSNSVIACWWDYGQWAKVVGQRRVIFDNQCQMEPQGYWMGKVLLSEDEQKARAILRMLVNGGNKAFETIRARLKDPLISALLLEGVLDRPPEDASDLLGEFLPPEEAAVVLRLLFAAPADPAIMMVDADLAYYMMSISVMGTWDFAKVFIARNWQSRTRSEIESELFRLGQKPERIRRLTDEAAEYAGDWSSWISKKTGFWGPPALGQMTPQGDWVFENGFVYRPSTGDIQTSSGDIPVSLVIVDVDGDTRETVFPQPTFSFSVLIARSGSESRCLVLDPSLARTLYVRLQFCDGKGLRYFVPLAKAYEDANKTIGLFTISWD